MMNTDFQRVEPPPFPPPTVAPASVVVAALLRSRIVSVLALGVLVVALVLPPHGFGVPTCQFRELTHLPCFGCGLTRSFVGMAHLNPLRAAFFHPAGVPLFLLTLFYAALLPARTQVRERFARWVEERGRLVTYLAVSFLTFFVLYGLGRMVWVAGLLGSGQPSPW